ncbi:MAG: ABC transporter permease [Gemmatimonadota bacterium]|jgi:ABC-type lipoprotein release transport system permease subunit
MISATIGFRNLARNRWRSSLTLGGIAVSVAFMVWILGFMEGWLVEMVRGATAVETGQVQVHTAAFAESPRADRSFALEPSLLRDLRAVDGVESVSPRIRLFGLIGHEEKSQVAQIMGVDPVLEAQTTPITDGLESGRWLTDDPPPYPAPREVVLGTGVARQLRVGIGDELVIFFEAADGSLGNDLLEVVGIVRTGNTAVDRSAVYMNLADTQFLAALDGEIHELTIRTKNFVRTEQTRDAVAAALGARTDIPVEPDGEDPPNDVLVARSWQQIMPSIDQVLTLSRQSYLVTYLLIYLVAAVGILNTQRMSALERRREFGVLMAIGMRPRRMFRMIVTESLVLGTLGGVLGTVLGVAVTWYHSVHGLNLGIFTDQGGFTWMGVAFSGRIYAILNTAVVIQPVLVMVFVAFLVGLWPALKSARIDPAPTIAGRT